MHDPARPGEVLAGWIADLGLSVTAFAKHLGISRVMLSRILNGHAAVTAGFMASPPAGKRAPAR
ncbi:MAG: HigA family addiction module antitoxin [Azonexus sp.]